jgi:hypothetical protein
MHWLILLGLVMAIGAAPVIFFRGLGILLVIAGLFVGGVLLIGQAKENPSHTKEDSCIQPDPNNPSDPDRFVILSPKQCEELLKQKH